MGRRGLIVMPASHSVGVKGESGMSWVDQQFGRRFTPIVGKVTLTVLRRCLRMSHNVPTEMILFSGVRGASGVTILSRQSCAIGDCFADLKKRIGGTFSFARLPSAVAEREAVAWSVVISRSARVWRRAKSHATTRTRWNAERGSDLRAIGLNRIPVSLRVGPVYSTKDLLCR
jgi:hypothetical protein